MVEERELSDFEIEHKQILGSIKTRWLSLQPAITKSYSHVSGIRIVFYLPRKMSDDAEKILNHLLSIVCCYAGMAFLVQLLHHCLLCHCLVSINIFSNEFNFRAHKFSQLLFYTVS